jgi:hypothetical protein
METEKCECKGNICNHVLLVIRTIASKSKAIKRKGRYDWDKMSRDVLPFHLFSTIQRAKKHYTDSIAFRAFDDAWKEVLENDPELSFWFALKVWALALVSETDENRDFNVREDAALAAKYLSDVASVIENRLSQRVH